MANSKISALTSASTPLAGTEVLPIVQSGATVKVSVANLTAGRSVAASAVVSSTIGAASAAALNIQSNGTTNAILDTSGNLGLGVTPSAWGSGYKAFEQVGGSLWSYNANEIDVYQNAYFNGTNNIYKTSAAASRYEQNSGNHRWYIASSGTAGNTISFTQAMTIDTSANFLLGGTNTDPSGNAVNGFTYVTSGNALSANRSGNAVFFLGRSTSSGEIIQFRYNGSNIGNIATNGSNVTYNSTSDYRLKENIAPMTGALAKVQALKPVTYTWKNGGQVGEGFIAHELAEVCPEAVTGEKDGTEIQQYEISAAVPATYDKDGNQLTVGVNAVMGEREVPKYQSIDVSFLVATLTAAIQEQQKQIDELKAQVAALKPIA